MIFKTKNSSNDLIFNKIYLLKKKISSGSFGEVYLCENLQTKEEFAIKLEEFSKNDEDLRSVLRESNLLSKLTQIKGIPKILWYGTEHSYDCLVMELLGLDLAALLKTQKKFSLKTIVMLANQIIPLIEQIHEKNIIHRDIKPENILIGKNDMSNIIYILDFGISKNFRDMHGRHIIYRENKPFIGTTRYASISSHKGYELARRDDLESLGYMLLFLKKGSLPWQNLTVSEKEKNKIVGKMKDNISNIDLCRDLPAEFVIYFDYVKGLNFKDEPDYTYLRSLFIKIAQEHHFDLEDNVWDWSKGRKDSFSCLKENIENRKPKISSTKDFSEEDEEPKNGLNFLGIARHQKPKKYLPALKETQKEEKFFQKYGTVQNESLLIPPNVKRTNGRQNSFTGSMLSSFNSVENYYVPSQIYLKNPEEYEDGKIINIYIYLYVFYYY